MTTPEANRTVVLNVDDYEASRYVRTQVLRHAGFNVVEVGTGKDAIASAITSPPGLILLDMNLPDMSGLQVCRTLKADSRTTTVPVLHISATFTTSADTVVALDSGADAYLSEPVEPPVLLATINALLRARRAEEALAAALARERTARQEAETAGRAKDEFLATLSHELRAPLSAILGWTRILRSGRLDRGQALHALEVIERSTLQQTQLIADMLDVSRIITGQLRLDVGPMNFASVVVAALDTVRPAAEAKRLRVALLAEAADAPILGDAARLQQVVWNLLSNAVKFTPPGGAVRVQLAPGADDVRLVVADTGQGIAPDFLPHVFERFRQAESGPARTHPGLGLGLAIVRHIVEGHGGTVTVESAGTGRGTTFTVVLPRHDGTGMAPASESGAAAPAAAPRHPALLVGVHVLVVEDDVDTREVLTATLQMCGARVTSADTMPAALEALRRDEPDVLVSDIGMPGSDGYALIATIRALPARDGGDVRAIAVTGYATAQDEARVLRAGYDVHLAKPVDPDDLAAAVAGLVRQTG